MAEGLAILAIPSAAITKCMLLTLDVRRRAIFERAESGTRRREDLLRRALDLPCTLDRTGRRAHHGAARGTHLGSVGSAAGVRKEVSEGKAGADSVLMAAVMRRRVSEAEATSAVGTPLGVDIPTAADTRAAMAAGIGASRL